MGTTRNDEMRIKEKNEMEVETVRVVFIIGFVNDGKLVPHW